MYKALYVIYYMLSESYFSFAPCTTFATNAFSIRDNYCRLQKNVVTLHSETNATQALATPPQTPSIQVRSTSVTGPFQVRSLNWENNGNNKSVRKSLPLHLNPECSALPYFRFKDIDFAMMVFLHDTLGK